MQEKNGTTCKLQLIDFMMDVNSSSNLISLGTWFPGAQLGGLTVKNQDEK